MYTASLRSMADVSSRTTHAAIGPSKLACANGKRCRVVIQTINRSARLAPRARCQLIAAAAPERTNLVAPVASGPKACPLGGGSMGLIARNGRMTGPTDDGWFPVAC